MIFHILFKFFKKLLQPTLLWMFFFNLKILGFINSKQEISFIINFSSRNYFHIHFTSRSITFNLLSSMIILAKPIPCTQAPPHPKTFMSTYPIFPFWNLSVVGLKKDWLTDPFAFFFWYNFSYTSFPQVHSSFLAMLFWLISTSNETSQETSQVTF